jgi:exosortase
MNNRFIAFIGCAAVITAAQTDVLSVLYAYSRANASASHVVVIPLVSLALVLQRRHEIFRSVKTDWVAGVAILAPALVLAAATRVTRPVTPDATTLAVLTTPIVLGWVGVFVLAFGREALWRARFASAFLLFTVPVPVPVLDAFTQALKAGSAAAVAALFTVTGTPFHRDGFVFSLPALAIEVADECSGIRSSIALLLTALLAGDQYLVTGWRKVVLALAILPVTIFKNGVRIVTLSLLAAHVDPSFLAGRLHHDGGIAFFVLALGMLLPVLHLLRRSEATGADHSGGADAAHITGERVFHTVQPGTFPQKGQ